MYICMIFEAGSDFAEGRSFWARSGEALPPSAPKNYQTTREST